MSALALDLVPNSAASWAALGAVASAALTGVLALYARHAYLVAAGSLRTQVKTLQTQAESLGKQSSDAIRANSHRRAEATMRFVRDWRACTTRDYQLLVQHAAGKKQPLATILANFDLSDTATRSLIRPVLEDLEHLALGVRYGAYDGNIVFQMARSNLIAIHRKFEPYIRRVRQGDHANDAQPHAFEHFEWLAGELQEQTKRPAAPLPGSLIN